MDNAKSIFETEEVEKLLPRFALPSVISGMVSAIYNIVDQIFIGHGVGMLGNAATNVTFPIVTVCTAVSIMCGVGCATGFNLETGKGNYEKAGRLVCNNIVLMGIIGILIETVVLLFMSQLLYAFGATESLWQNAETYLSITALSIPLSIIGVGGSIVIRSDGSPKYALYSVLTGALLNVFLDWLFIFKFDMGIAGAAYATVIGQVVSGILVLAYFFKFKTFRLKLHCFKPNLHYFAKITSLGMGPFVNNITMFVVQILLNNSLKHYGAISQYGSEIPLACVGVITKLNSIFNAIVVGIAQGVQPIISYNYGAKNYKRVIEAAKKVIIIIFKISFVMFLLCQLFPRQLVSIFGTGSELYYSFAERYLRIFMMLICVNGMQVTVGNMFTSIGKARLSVFISMTRQILFLPPLILLLPLFFGIDGIMYAGPIADGMCFIVAMSLLLKEYKRLKDEDLNIIN